MGLQVTVDCLSGHAEALGNCRAVAPLLQEAHHQGVLVSQWAPGLLTQPQVSEVGAHHGRWNAQGLGDDGPAVSLSEHPGDLRAAVGNGWPLHAPNHQPANKEIHFISASHPPNQWHRRRARCMTMRSHHLPTAKHPSAQSAQPGSCFPSLPETPDRLGGRPRPRLGLPR